MSEYGIATKNMQLRNYPREEVHQHPACSRYPTRPTDCRRHRSLQRATVASFEACTENVRHLSPPHLGTSAPNLPHDLIFVIKGKGSPYSITESRVPELIPVLLAVILQVTLIINPTVRCHYFPPGLQLLPQPLRGLLPVLLLCEQRHNVCEQFA